MRHDRLLSLPDIRSLLGAKGSKARFSTLDRRESMKRLREPIRGWRLMLACLAAMELAGVVLEEIWEGFSSFDGRR
jgi:hypothetical protein